MNNDFIKGMETLIECKKYVEWRLNYLQRRMEQMDSCGKDIVVIQTEIKDLKRVLGYKEGTVC